MHFVKAAVSGMMATKALADLTQTRTELARTKQDVGSPGTLRPLHATELKEAVRHTSDTR